MANGQTLVSPTNEIIISIKVQSGERGSNGLPGIPGTPGISPIFAVNETITGEPSTNALVTISGSSENPELTFTIPRGAKGEAGDAGVTGSSLFKMRDDLDSENNGFLITVSSEIKITGGNGIKVERNSGLFTISLPIIDGGKP